MTQPRNKVSVQRGTVGLVGQKRFGFDAIKSEKADKRVQGRSFMTHTHELASTV